MGLILDECHRFVLYSSPKLILGSPSRGTTRPKLVFFLFRCGEISRSARGDVAAADGDLAPLKSLTTGLLCFFFLNMVPVRAIMGAQTDTKAALRKARRGGATCLKINTRR